MDPPRPTAHWTSRIAALEDELQSLRAAATKESAPIPLRAPPTPAAATGDATFLLALLEREMRRNDDLERKLDDARAAKIDLLIENGHLRTRLQVSESMLAATRGRTDRDDTPDRPTTMPPSRRSSSAPGGDKKSTSRRISISTEDRLRFLNLLDGDTLPLRGDSSSPGSDAASDSDTNDAPSSRTPSRRSIGGTTVTDDTDTPPHRRVRSLSRDSVVSDLSSAELRLIKDRDRRLSTRNTDHTPSPAASPATTASSAAPPMDLSGQELRMLVKRHSRDDILNIASPMAASPISGTGSGSASVTFGIGTPGGGAPPSDLSASERKILTKRGSREHVAMAADMPVVARRLSASRRGSQDLLPTVGNGTVGHAARSGDSLISDLSTAELRLLPGVANESVALASPHDAITSDDDEDINDVENDPLEAGYRRVHMSKENLVSDLSHSEKKLLVKPNHGTGSGAASPLAPTPACGVVPGDVVLDSSTRLLFHDPLASIHAYNAVMPADPIQVAHHSHHHRTSASPGPSGGAMASPLGTRTGSSSNLAASGSPAGGTHERKVVILARDSEAGSRESLASVGRHVAFATADEEHVVAAADSDDEHAVPRKVVAFAAGATAASSGLGREDDSGEDEDDEGEGDEDEDEPRSRVVSFGDLVEASSGGGVNADAAARTTPSVTLSNRTLDSIPDEGAASEAAAGAVDAAGLAMA
ncbi:hypothetical protein AMAG_02584 [Allomyces macrogynus ATCC 38327]|uniref:Uncharacterized protein n=1 Tax=Allomyces macrogynus (strain ATCC 38327) TaxID=578462 RepID=A0A0L0S2P3_ALLM3|nr:hypothetical protein AMAG_02584 [Allomyces macrogynus ATCC 38327]|eukprot:KNE56808.1 hypothetical protein AMAG_02584 [Allomyces macrogynus ATCC 38327]